MQELAQPGGAAADEARSQRESLPPQLGLGGTLGGGAAAGRQS
jgi:hypothetical protein